mgnify:FL=1
MTRYHMVNGVNEPFTTEEETLKDAEEAAWLLKNPIRSEAYLEAEVEIERLEATITPRRLRDAIANDAGKSWVAAVEALIDTERGKL